MAYELVPYDVQHLPEILSLERALWSQDSGANAAYFEWKYRQNPYVDRPHLYVVLHRGTVIGVRGFYGTAWSLGTEPTPFVTPTGGDTVVAPQHRSRGLFEKLDRFARAHC